jgi:hypothetical protein
VWCRYGDNFCGGGRVGDSGGAARSSLITAKTKRFQILFARLETYDCADVM